MALCHAVNAWVTVVNTNICLKRFEMLPGNGYLHNLWAEVDDLDTGEF